MAMVVSGAEEREGERERGRAVGLGSLVRRLAILSK
jgi:hypothetical protein